MATALVVRAIDGSLIELQRTEGDWGALPGPLDVRSWPKPAPEYDG
jgi:hypothetical protein